MSKAHERNRIALSRAASNQPARVVGISPDVYHDSRTDVPAQQLGRSKLIDNPGTSQELRHE
jgi:hypothetical protein